MIYKAYLTESLEHLYHEVFVGEFVSEEDAFKAAYAEHQRRGYYVDRYTRGLMNPDGTYYDVGCWSHFIAVIPVH